MFPYKSQLKIHLEKCNGLKKQKLKNVEYHFIEDDNSGRRYKCHKCEKKFRTHEIVIRHKNIEKRISDVNIVISHFHFMTYLHVTKKFIMKKA